MLYDLDPSIRSKISIIEKAKYDTFFIGETITCLARCYPNWFLPCAFLSGLNFVVIKLLGFYFIVWAWLVGFELL